MLRAGPGLNLPVLLQTWAYREHTKGSDDLGDNEEFTRRLSEGYAAYADALARAPAARARVAPAGAAFRSVHLERPELWRRLFHTDGFHPSPHGSYLVACVVHCEVARRAPPAARALPDEPAALWARARRMQPPSEPPLPMPTRAELEYLREVAMRACGVGE